MSSVPAKPAVIVARRRPAPTALALAISLSLAASGRLQAANAIPISPGNRRDADALGDEYLFIDGRVARHAELEAAVRAGVKVRMIDPARDGIDQISAVLAGERRVRAVHVLAHGAPGSMQLGATRVDNASLARYRDQLIRWFAHRNSARWRPELLLYACDLAGDASGRELLQRLSALTGANVAASVNITGGLALNADWNLELATGRIESTLPFERSAAEAYPATLANFTVTNLDDAGPGSLRANIAASTTDDTIVFQSGLSGTLSLSSGPLYIDHALSVQGPGASAVRVDGNRASTVFGIDSSVSAAVSISGLTIANGRNTRSNAARPLIHVQYEPCGGGIYSNGANLSLSNVVITGNNAYVGGGVCFFGNGVRLDIADSTVSGNLSYNDGGGVFFYGDKFLDAAVTRSTFSGNFSAHRSGGALASERAGSLTVSDSIFTGNHADAGYGGALFTDDMFNGALVTRSTFSGNSAYSGGAITFYQDVYHGAHVLDRSTVSGNTAAHKGGGLSFYRFTAGPIAIVDSTISGNTVDGKGGGVYFYRNYLYGCAIANTTLSGNTATGFGGGAYLYNGGSDDTRCRFFNSTIVDNNASDGGGLFAFNEVDVHNTVLSGNTAGQAGTANDVDGFSPQLTTFFAAFSLVRDPGSRATLDSSGGGVIVDADPILGPLADNGGPTLTHVPLPGSPLVNGGSNALAAGLANDQRGLPRIFGGTVDIGAVESALGQVFRQDVPALSASGRYALALLCGAAGLALLRRRRGIAGVSLALAIGAGGLIAIGEVRDAESASAVGVRVHPGHVPAQFVASTIARVARSNGRVTVDLGDGQRFDVPEAMFRITSESIDTDHAPRSSGSRFVRHAAEGQANRAHEGDFVVAKVRFDNQGEIKRLTLVKLPDAEQARILAQQQRGHL